MTGLTLPEIIYLVSLNGTEYFYGVNDGISDLSENEKNLLLVEAENKLIASGYIEMDFDGNLVLPETIRGKIDCLSFPESVVSMRNLNSNDSVSFFRKGRLIIELNNSGSGYLVKNAGAERMVEVFDEFIMSGRKYIDDINKSIVFSDFLKASKAAFENYEKSKNEFEKLGFNKDEAEILSDVYAVKEPLIFIEMEVLTGNLHSDKYLKASFDGKILDISADITEEDKIVLKTVTSETAMSFFEKMLSDCGFKGDFV